jgi:hypothetical protein
MKKLTLFGLVKKTPSNPLREGTFQPETGLISIVGKTKELRPYCSSSLTNEAA